MLFNIVLPFLLGARYGLNRGFDREKGQKSGKNEENDKNDSNYDIKSYLAT